MRQIVKGLRSCKRDKILYAQQISLWLMKLLLKKYRNKRIVYPLYGPWHAIKDMIIRFSLIIDPSQEMIWVNRKKPILYHVSIIDSFFFFFLTETKSSCVILFFFFSRYYYLSVSLFIAYYLVFPLLLPFLVSSEMSFFFSIINFNYHVCRFYIDFNYTLRVSCYLY